MCCEDNILFVHRFSRHDPDNVSYMKGNGEKVTFREEIAKGENTFYRTDIGMVTVGCQWDCKHLRQYCVYATPNGGITGDGIKWMGESDLEWMREESTRIQQTVDSYPIWRMFQS